MTEQEYSTSSVEEIPEVVDRADIQDVNLLAVQFRAPKRRGRGYDADQVDQTLRAAQKHLDMQFAYIQQTDALPNTEANGESAVSDERFTAMTEALREAQEALDSATRARDEATGLVSQLKAANTDLRNELRDVLAGQGATSHVVSDVEEPIADTIYTDAERASGILAHAERVAQAHISEAKAQAETIIREAEERAQNVEPVAIDAVYEESPSEAALRKIQELANDALSEKSSQD